MKVTKNFKPFHFIAFCILIGLYIYMFIDIMFLSGKPYILKWLETAFITVAVFVILYIYAYIAHNNKNDEGHKDE